MKKKIYFIAILLGLLIQTSFSANGNKSIDSTDVNKRIDEIVNNPGPYVNEKVQISGIVTQYVPPTANTTSYYLVQGDFGSIMKIITIRKPPVISKKYKITGVVQIDQNDGRPMIIENYRMIIIPTITWILGGVVLILIGFLVFYVFRNLLSSGGQRDKNYDYSKSPNPSQNDPELQTIRIVTDGPPTMIVIKGELEIISGLDRGKSFPIAGYPTSEGALVTIGRETVRDDRRYAHIQLLEKTVSRKQAELIYYRNNATLMVKNLSLTNNTQVDGRMLGLNELVEIKPGMIIKVGEVEFRYKI